MAIISLVLFARVMAAAVLFCFFLCFCLEIAGLLLNHRMRRGIAEI